MNWNTRSPSLKIINFVNSAYIARGDSGIIIRTWLSFDNQSIFMDSNRLKQYRFIYLTPRIKFSLNETSTYRFVDIDMLKYKRADKIAKEENFETH